MNQYLLSAPIGLAAIALVNPAGARAQSIDPSALLPLDITYNGLPIGRSFQQNLMLRQVGGTLYSMSTSYGGLSVNAIFWFASKDCTGPAKMQYLDNVQQPIYTYFDGETVWTPGKTYTWIHPHSYSWFFDYQTYQVKPQCIPYDPMYTIQLTDPKKVEDEPKWAPKCTTVTDHQPDTGDQIIVPTCTSIIKLRSGPTAG